MGKKEEKLEYYKTHIVEFTKNVDFALLEGIFNYLGPSIFKVDAELVSTNDEKELETVKTSFLRKKLKISKLGDDKLDEAILEVRDILGKSNKRKYRIFYYYFLTKKFNKESVFVKNSINNNLEIEKLKNIIKITKKDNNNEVLYLTLALNLIVILFLIIVLNL